MTPQAAVVLAGGLGTRMHPLTDLRPKPALLIDGVPLLGHQLIRLRENGIDDIVVATAYRAEMLRALVGNGSRYGVRVRFVQERRPLGTGGALRLAVSGIAPDTVVTVVNGDQLSRHDLLTQIQVVLDDEAELALHARDVDDARPFGLLRLDGPRIAGFEEKPSDLVAGVVNAGTYVLRAALVQDLPLSTVISLEREVFPQLIAQGHRVVAVRDNAYGLDVGNPAALLQANLDAVSPADHWVAQDARIGAGSTVLRSVVMPGAVVGAGCRISDSIVAQGAVIADGVDLTWVVVGENARVERQPTPGIAIGTGELLR
ncbi:sugar phosphate nucleotidyltransferase [Calidifontibacter terrae]